MIFRQMYDMTSGTYTYLLASRRGGEALIVDPVLEKVDRYLQLMRELDLRLVKAVDTHLHADHITGLGALRDRTHCVTVMGEQSQVDVVSMRIAEGDKLTIEGISLDVMYTPGHTDDSYCFLMGDRVLTGDTLLIRGTGRTDFQNGDSRAQRHGQHDRRGEGEQPAPAGALGRGIRRADGQSEAVQSEDDGCRGAGQHTPGPRAGSDCRARLGGNGGGRDRPARQAGRGIDRPPRAH